jgi:hypothetical protein
VLVRIQQKPHEEHILSKAHHTLVYMFYLPCVKHVQLAETANSVRAAAPRAPNRASPKPGQRTLSTAHSCQASVPSAIVMIVAHKAGQTGRASPRRPFHAPTRVLNRRMDSDGAILRRCESQMVRSRLTRLATASKRATVPREARACREAPHSPIHANVLQTRSVTAAGKYVRSSCNMGKMTVLAAHGMMVLAVRRHCRRHRRNPSA